MILHDDGHSNVIGDDSLDRPDTIRKRSGNNGFKESAFDLILTNPPFGAQINLTERPYLSDFDWATRLTLMEIIDPGKTKRLRFSLLSGSTNFSNLEQVELLSSCQMASSQIHHCNMCAISSSSVSNCSPLSAYHKQHSPTSVQVSKLV